MTRVKRGYIARRRRRKIRLFGSSFRGAHFTESRQGIPLITGRFDSLEQLDEFSRSF